MDLIPLILVISFERYGRLKACLQHNSIHLYITLMWHPATSSYHTIYTCFFSFQKFYLNSLTSVFKFRFHQSYKLIKQVLNWTPLFKIFEFVMNRCFQINWILYGSSRWWVCECRVFVKVWYKESSKLTYFRVLFIL